MSEVQNAQIHTITFTYDELLKRPLRQALSQLAGEVLDGAKTYRVSKVTGPLEAKIAEVDRKVNALFDQYSERDRSKVGPETHELCEIFGCSVVKDKFADYEKAREELLGTQVSFQVPWLIPFSITSRLKLAPSQYSALEKLFAAPTEQELAEAETVSVVAAGKIKRPELVVPPGLK